MKDPIETICTKNQECPLYVSDSVQDGTCVSNVVHLCDKTQKSEGKVIKTQSNCQDTW